MFNEISYLCRGILGRDDKIRMLLDTQAPPNAKIFKPQLQSIVLQNHLADF